MISRTAEYALRALVYLAAVQGEQPSQTVEQIAAGTRIPVGYLAKVLQSLTRAGLLTSQRGLGGGFRLAKPATQMTIYEVVQAVDAVPRIRECPLGLEMHAGNLCPLHARLDAAMAQAEQAFKDTTLADLVQNPAPLCTSNRATLVR